jgi:hypothetical protein
MMPNSAHQNEIQIDRSHGGEVCMEIGERLSVALGQQSTVLPGRLVALIEELAKAKPGESPAEIETDLDP